MASLHTTLSSAVALFTVLTAADSGITCAGSDSCPYASFDSPDSVGVLQGLLNGIWLSSLDNGTMYDTYDHIICVSTSAEVTIGVDAGGNGIDASLETSDEIGDGGICAYPQNLDTPLSLAEIIELANALLDYGCDVCGSVPVHYVDEDSNDPTSGILTFDYVADPYCDDNCISADNDTEQDDDTGDSSASAAETSAATVSPAATTTVIRTVAGGASVSGYSGGATVTNSGAGSPTTPATSTESGKSSTTGSSGVAAVGATQTTTTTASAASSTALGAQSASSAVSSASTSQSVTASSFARLPLVISCSTLALVVAVYL